MAAGGVGLGRIAQDPQGSVVARRNWGRLATPDLIVLGTNAVYIDDDGRLRLRLNGATLSQDASGLRINPAGSPILTGLTLTGFAGFLFGTAGVVSAVNTVATTLYSSITQQGNTQPNETALFNYLVPGGTLAATGDSLEFAACGTFTNGTARRLRVRFGTDTSGLGSNTLLFDTGSFTTTASDWSLRGSITRSGATTQKNEITIITTSATVIGADTSNADTSYNGVSEYTVQAAYSTDINDKYNSADYTTSAETLANNLYLGITGFHASTSNVVVGERFKVIKQPG